jgi:predicted dehydrogenase
MSKKIGIGVIGMGWMGQTHSRSYRQIPSHFPESGIQPRLVICADDVQERVDKAQSVLGFEESTTDWRKVIDHPDVDVVNITTPNHLHVEIVEAAAAAGKHIYCEKPVGRYADETVQIEYLARKAGILSLVGYNYRWAPLVQYAKQLIQEDKLGELTHYRGRFYSMYGSNPYGLLTWRFKYDVAGYGVLGDLMSHAVDMAHMIVGPIKRVVSHSHTTIKQRPLPIPGKGTHYGVGQEGDPMGEVTNEDHIEAMVEFENGVRGTLGASRAMVGPKTDMAFNLHGTKGALGWNFEQLNELQVYLPSENQYHDGYTTLLGGDKYPHHGNFVPGDANAIGYEDLKAIEAYQFLQSVADGEQREPGFAETLAVAEVQDAMLRSWKSGTWEDVKSLRKE